MMHLWGPSEGARCPCRCHGVVIIDPLSAIADFKAYLNSPPRYDSSLAWAESCAKCETSHWLATTVHDEIVQIEANEKENLAVYYITHPRTNGNADC